MLEAGARLLFEEQNALDVAAIAAFPEAEITVERIGELAAFELDWFVLPKGGRS